MSSYTIFRYLLKRRVYDGELPQYLLEEFSGNSAAILRAIDSLGTRASTTLQIPAHRGHPFRRIADNVPVIADSW